MQECSLLSEALLSLRRGPKALANIRGGAGFPGLRGTVRFYEEPEAVLIAAEIFGLPDGFHGFHIHEGQNCGGEGFANSGSHYNPTEAQHPNHAGDLPVLMSCNGTALLIVRTQRFRLPEVLGRTVIIHKEPDDYRTQPAGNAGEKIACGVIVPC